MKLPGLNTTIWTINISPHIIKTFSDPDFFIVFIYLIICLIVSDRVTLDPGQEKDIRCYTLPCQYQFSDIRIISDIVCWWGSEWQMLKIFCIPAQSDYSIWWQPRQLICDHLGSHLRNFITSDRDGRISQIPYSVSSFLFRTQTRPPEMPSGP